MDAVKRYKHRRDARLGIVTFNHYDSVDEYRQRRKMRLEMRCDEDDGEWQTTDSCGVDEKK